MKLPFPIIATTAMRVDAARNVLEEIGKILFYINSNESGRIMETVIQLLPDDVFKTLALIVIGNENNEITRNLIYEFVCRIANKLNMEFDSPEPITEAAGSALVIINCENLRRKGYMEYLAPDNVFSGNSKNPGYNKLTESGKQVMYKEMLEM
jgi:hypothetical protein